MRTSYLAADFGSKAHTIIEEVVNEKDPEIPSRFLTVVNNFKLWRKQCRLNIVQTETMVRFSSSKSCVSCVGSLLFLQVASVKYGFAGCVDAVALKDDDGKLVIMDWKTSKQLSNEHAMQVKSIMKQMHINFD